MKPITPTEIAICEGIIWAAAIIVSAILGWNKMPTKQDENDLTNKLNRIALDRANRKDTK